MSESTESHFDVLVLGTGLTESIAASALSKAGLKVVHVDTNDYYGANEASLTVEEILRWVTETNARQGGAYSAAALSGEAPSPSRSYSLSLAPSVVASSGPLISSLVNSGVARYGGFKLLDCLAVYSSSKFKSVPGSKEEIFKSKDISLVDKRRLMRFLMFASGEFEGAPELQGRETQPFFQFLEEAFSVNKELATALTYAFAMCHSNTDPVLPALSRIRQYLRSAGRYGPSPFLVGHYGGLGELAQGFCRACAVAGGTYILGREICAVKSNPKHTGDVKGTTLHSIELRDLPEGITADIVITSLDNLASLKDIGVDENVSVESKVAFCVAVVDGSFSSFTSSSGSAFTKDDDNKTLPRDVDTALLIFPPGESSSLNAPAAVSVLINGEGTISCPRGKCILYLSTDITQDYLESGMSVDPESLLRPYLEATLSIAETTGSVPPREQFSAFYLQDIRSIPSPALDSLERYNVLVCPPLPTHFAMNGDVAARKAEELFRNAMRLLGRSEAEAFWPPLQSDPVDDE